MSNTGAFQYWQRSVIHSGPGTSVRIPNQFSGLGAKRVALISDKGLKDVGVVDKIAELFNIDAGPGAPKLVTVFTETAPDAESECINTALQQVRAAGADAILAVGGGSVLDSAKLIKLGLVKQVDHIGELMKSPVRVINWPDIKAMGIPHIAVATTAGTGAEITNGAVIYNKALGIKHLIFCDYMEADVAILDAQLTTGLPPMLTAATGMDALTHAVESFAHQNCNDFALAHALHSAKVIRENLPLAVKDGNNLKARQHMLNASAMAVNAVVADFGAAPVHNFSHAFGAVFHIHHGEANGVLLPAVMEGIPEFYEPCADRLKDVFDLTDAKPRDIVLAAAASIRALLNELGHPQNFERHNIPQSALPDIIKAVAHDPLAAFYPLTPEIIESIAKTACGWG
jgi:alcohol dehydrogenase class IV